MLEHIHDEDFGISDGEDSDEDVDGVTGYLPPAADSSLLDTENESSNSYSDDDDVNLSLPEPNLLERGILYFGMLYYLYNCVISLTISLYIF